jgi:hypothetical protein
MFVSFCLLYPTAQKLILFLSYAPIPAEYAPIPAEYAPIPAEYAPIPAKCKISIEKYTLYANCDCR